MTTPLAERLKRQIPQTGPITVADYMVSCLFDPDHGYYSTREPFGRGGDFVTAPEVSQMFGELVAIWMISAWQAAGSPENFAFAEIGPGRGTLMADMLRTLRKSETGFPGRGHIYMIETSPRLTDVQKKRLDKEAENIEWLTRFEEVADLPLFLVGNELFDAIPVRQYQRFGDFWLERMVGVDGNGRLAFMAGAGSLAADQLPASAAGQQDGTTFEVSPAREALAETIAEHIAHHGGAALIFDYGHLQPGFGETLQAVRNHNFDDVLSHPGEADLTSHVDFAALAAAVKRAGAQSASLTQGEFLLRMGLVERAGRLGINLDQKGRRQIEADVERLAGPEAMGELFKVMAIFEPEAKPAPF